MASLQVTSLNSYLSCNRNSLRLAFWNWAWWVSKWRSKSQENHLLMEFLGSTDEIMRVEAAAIYVLNVVPSLNNRSSLIGQCKEFNIIEVILFWVNTFLFTLWFQLSNECRLTLLFFVTKQTSLRWLPRHPFLALTVLDQVIDFMTYSSTVWSKFFDNYFVYTYNRVFNIIVIIFVMFSQNKNFIYSELLYYID